MSSLLRLSVGCLVLGLGASSAIAQETSEEVPGTGRTLGNHRFVPLQLVEWSMAVTRFSANTGLGFFEFTTPPSPLIDQLGDNQGDFMSVEETFAFELALTHRLALHVGGTGSVVLGSDKVGALDVGGTYAYGGEAGVLVSFLRTEHFVFSGLIDGQYLRYEGLVPSLLLGQIQVDADGNLVFPSLSSLSFTTDGDIWAFKPGLAAAYGVNRLLGLQASVSYRWLTVSSDGGDETASFVRAGVGATLDFRPIPITVGVAGSLGLEVNEPDGPTVGVLLGDGDPRYGVEAGVYYSGQPHLSVGVDATAEWLDDDQRLQLLARMIYYW